MSSPCHFFGVYRSFKTEDTEALIEKFAARHGNLLYKDDNLVLFDHGNDHWGGSSVFHGQKNIILVLGEPLLIQDDKPVERVHALPLLAKSFREGDAKLLSHCHGTFCGLYYDIERNRLDLFTDKIGLRGVFFASFDHATLFSTTYATLQEFLGRESAPDYQGIAEKIVFGYSLKDRTPLKACKRLLEAEIVHCASNVTKREHYHQWSSSINRNLSLKDAATRIDDAFTKAVLDRLEITPKESPFAFLSGGMDSRYIISTLCKVGRKPITLNVAPSATQDAIFGNQASEFFGTDHYAIPAETDSLANAIDSGTTYVSKEHLSKNAHLWWSGDGGSVGLGYVYMNKDSCPDTEKQALEISTALIKQNNWFLSERALKKNWRYLCEAPQNGIAEEINRHNNLPPEKWAYAFLLFNDQRRHLEAHYATLAERDYDLILPFFDARFIQAVLDTPSSYLLYHKLYNAIFEQHLPHTHTVPWQAYPGHEPCPHPVTKEGRYQWDDGWASRKNLRDAQRRCALEAFRSIWKGQTPKPSNTPIIFLAALLTYLGIKDMRYILRTHNAFLI